MNRKPFARILCGVFLASLSACDARVTDVIVSANLPDHCSTLDAERCAEDSLDGCSFQPNSPGCMPSDPSCGTGRCGSGDPFVRRIGEALFLHSAPFVFVGTVSWGIAWADNGCQVSAFETQEEALGKMFDELAAMQVSVLRFWAFQSFAGPSGADFSHFDRLVTKARAAGIRLIPVLENMHPQCTSGGARDDAWFAVDYQKPYGNYALSYRNYVTQLVTHFRDESTIMAWELMHEAGGVQFASLDAFAADMTSVVRGIDPNHRIALGLDAGTTPATSTTGDPSNYFKLQDRREIDLIDVHDFNAPDDAIPAQLAQCRAVARALGKPIFLGAAAVNLQDASAASFTLRTAQLERKFAATLSDDFRGFLVYDYVPGWTNPTFDFDSRSDEPLAGPSGMIARAARTVKE